MNVKEALEKGLLVKANSDESKVKQSIKISRHESLYGLDPDFKKEDAEYAVEVANEFIKRINSL